MSVWVTLPLTTGSLHIPVGVGVSLQRALTLGHDSVPRARLWQGKCSSCSNQVLPFLIWQLKIVSAQPLSQETETSRQGSQGISARLLSFLRLPHSLAFPALGSHDLMQALLNQSHRRGKGQGPAHVQAAGHKQGPDKVKQGLGSTPASGQACGHESAQGASAAQAWPQAADRRPEGGLSSQEGQGWVT